MLRHQLLAGCGALAVSFALAGPAVAASQNDDPQVDPGSPAGTEYQLPVDRAREQASGGGSGAPGSSTGSTGSTGTAPLFGEGVKPSKSGKGSTAKTTTTGEQPGLGTATPEIVRSQAAAPDGGGSGLLPIAGIAAGVLLLGAIAGILWRRRSVRS
jgi:hypothetical protein